MSGIKKALSTILGNVAAAVVMLILAIIAFFITIFIVDSAASIAGLAPAADYVVLSAALLTAASVLGGMWKDVKEV